MQRYGRDLEIGEAEPEEEMVGRVNKFRSDHDLGPLRYSVDLFTAAKLHAEYSTEGSFVTHRGSEGTTPGHRARGVGYHYSVLAENVGSAPTVIMMFNLWRGSKNHKANMLVPEVEDIGIGIAEDFRGLKYWVLLLGRRLDVPE